MLLDFTDANAVPDTDLCESRSSLWGASSETGRLTDVLLSVPAHLTMVPCNHVTREHLANGLSTTSAIADRQHSRFAAALESEGVRCHYVGPVDGLPDLSFTRDSVLMTPWGMVELRPAASHRRSEPEHVAAGARKLGIPIVDRIVSGMIEGGDVCLMREGLVVMGCSNERTNQVGAAALGTTFAARGWDVVHTRFDPRYLHLDTILTMVGDDVAVGCPEALDASLLERMRALGIEIIPASTEEVARLGANLLSIGDGRVLTPADNGRLSLLLKERGFDVIEVDIDQFTRCGGGPHCLTMPLARRA